jgi:hypothetical protein
VFRRGTRKGKGINQSSGKATKILEDNLLAIYEPDMHDNASIHTANIKEWIDLTADYLRRILNTPGRSLKNVFIS